jgi:hypothetical protein
MLNGKVALDTMKSRIAALGGNKITATDARYRAGVIEGYVAVLQAAEIAKMEGVSAVHLVLKPVTNIGEATTQGIKQHRIDKLPAGINGAGITVGVLSDSFNTNGGPIKAGDDVASGDLPGPANPFGHTKPVVILQDDPSGTDEGRAMLQIVHNIAPDARLGFATANNGQVGFADNIRSLASLPSGSLSRPNFKADVIIDDVIYFAEPMFQDGISDASQDPDSLPNFFGTSAAAPHAGGIAALMLQAAGGPQSLSPDAVRAAMQKSAFLHDLDPSHAEGVAQGGGRKVFFSATGDGRDASSATDPNFFMVTFTGPGSLTSFELNLTNANPTETHKGLVFDPHKSTGFPFTLGNLTGVPQNAISSAFSMPAPAPAGPGYFQELTLSIAADAMMAGEVIRFGVDRDEANAFGPNATVGGNSADLLGAGVLIPQGIVAPGGAAVSASL